MFTGLVEEIGRIDSTQPLQSGLRMMVQADKVIEQLSIGDSLAVNGVCLTVVERQGDIFAVEVVGESLERTTLSSLRSGDPVHLERALQPQSRLAGHFVQGHVDGIGKVVALDHRHPGYWLQIRLPASCQDFVVEKGSIAVDGVSLTVADIQQDVVAIAVIPHTAEHTLLADKKPGDLVNIEADILGKYVLNFMQRAGSQGSISPEKLQQWGY